MSLFLSLAQGHLLQELARGRNSIATPRFLAAKMALADQVMPPENAVRLLGAAFHPGTTESDATSMALGAFWFSVAGEITLPPVATQLLINPPIGLKIEDNRTLVTVRSESWAGEYGFTCGALSDPVIQSATPEHFEDVSVFFSDRMPLDAWLPRVQPGTTLTVYFPAPHHMPWIGFFGVRPFEPKDDEMRSFRLVYDAVLGEVLTMVYGTEGRS